MEAALAKLGCPIPYDPDGRADRLQPVTDEAVQAARFKQHLNLQEIEHLIEALTVKDEFTDKLRCMTLGEFMNAYRDKTSNVHKYGSCVKELFVDFRPGTRPVLWRILITQTYLYNALMNTFNGTTEALMDPLALLTLEQQKDFDWRRSDAEASFEQAVVEPFTAAREYLAQRLTLPSLEHDGLYPRHAADRGGHRRRRGRRGIIRRSGGGRLECSRATLPVHLFMGRCRALQSRETSWQLGRVAVVASGRRVPIASR